MAKALKIVGIVVGVVALAATGIGLVVGAGAFLGIAGATFAAVGAIAGVVGGVLALGQTLLASSSKPTFASQGNPLQFVTNPQSGLPYAIGRTRMSGLRIHAETYDAPSYPSEGKEDVVSFVALLSAGGPHDAIESFKATKEAVTFDGAGAAVGSYAGWMAQATSLGLAGASALALSFGGAGVPNWGVNHKLTGMSHVLWSLRHDAKGNKFQSGVPEPEWVGRWAKVYDPRKDSTYPGGAGLHRALQENTYEWSRNPHLHALTWALGRWQNGKKVLGIGAPVANIRVADFVSAANISDTNFWFCGGVEWSTEAPWTVFKKMLQAGGAEPTMQGAMIGCRVHTPRVGVTTVQEADLLDELVISATKSRRDRFNTVIPRIRSENHDWDIVSGSPVVEATYVTQDGGRRTKEIDFPLVQHEVGQTNVDGFKQAGQLAAYEIVNSREATIRLSVPPKFIGIRTGDAVTLNIPLRGLNNQLAVVRTIERDPTTLKIRWECETETTSKHAYALGQTVTAPLTWAPAIPNLTPPLPATGNWTATSGSLTSGAPGILVTGNVEYPGADAAVVQFKRTVDSTWRTAGEYPANEPIAIIIVQVDASTSYDVQVNYRSGSRYGPYLARGPVTTPAAYLSGVATTVVGQGALATQNTALWSTQVIGIGKPSDNATTDLNLTQIVLGAGAGTIVGNTVTKTSAVASWDFGAKAAPLTGTAFIRGRVGVTGGVIGLGNTNAITVDTLVGLVASLYWNGTGWQINASYYAVTSGGVAIGDVNSVAMVVYDGIKYRFYLDGVEVLYMTNVTTVLITTVYNTTAASGLTLVPRVAFYGQGWAFKEIAYGPWSENAFSSIGGPGRPSDNAGTSGYLKSIGSFTTITGNTVVKVGGTHGAEQGGAVGQALFGSSFISSSPLCDHTGTTMPGGGWLTRLALDDDATSFTTAAMKYYMDASSGSATQLTITLFADGVSSGGITVNATPATRLALAYDGTRIRALADGVEVHSMPAAAGQKLWPKLLDYWTPAGNGFAVKDVLYGPWTDNNYSSLAGAPVDEERVWDMVYASKTDFDRDWTATGPGETTFPVTNDFGGKAVKFGDNLGNDQVQINANHWTAFDPNALYEITMDVEIGTSAVGNLLFLGVQAVDRNNVTLGNSHNYVVASALDQSANVGRVVRKAYIKGHAAISAGAPGSTPTSPTSLPDGTTGQAVGALPAVKFRPLVLASNNSLAGQVTVHRVQIRKLTGAIETQTTLPYGGQFLTGFGALAPLNTADFATYVSGAAKPENNATVGARIGTNFRDSANTYLSDPDVMNWRDESNVGLINLPTGGLFQNPVANVTGRIKITMPPAAATTMITFDVVIYNYVTGTSCTYKISGFLEDAAGQQNWFNVSAQLIGPREMSLRVTFGYAAGYPAVTIGFDGTVWQYPTITVRNVQTSYSNQVTSTWRTGWAVTIVAGELAGTLKTIENPRSGDAVFGTGVFEDGTTGPVATLAAFKTSVGTAALLFNQGALATLSRVGAGEVANGVVSPGLIMNGDAENGTTAGWKDGGYATGTGNAFGVSPTTPYAGSQSFTLTKPLVTNTNAGESRAVPCKAGVPMVVSGAWMGDVASTAGGYFRLAYGTGITTDGFLTGGFVSGDLTGGSNSAVPVAWKYFEELVTPPAGALYMCIVIINHLNAPLVMRFDAINIRPQVDFGTIITGLTRPENNATFGGNMIFNGNAELGTTDGWVFGASDGGTAQSMTVDPSYGTTGRYGFGLNKGVVADATDRTGRAFAVVGGKKYIVRINLNGNVGTASGLYIRMNEKTSTPADGVRVVTDRTSYTDLASNAAVPGGATTLQYVYTPPTGVRFVSPAVLNWTNGPTILRWDDFTMEESAWGPNAPEDRADVSVQFQNAVDQTILATNAGAPKTGQLPRTSLLKMIRNGIDVTAQTTWLVTILSGTCTTSIGANTGNLSVDASAGVFTTSRIRVTTVNGGYTRAFELMYTRVDDPAPTSGGGGGTSASTNLVGTVTSTTFVVISVELTLTTGTAGTVTLTTPNAGFTVAEVGPPGSFNLFGIWQWWNGSAWVDLGTETAASLNCTIVFDAEFGVYYVDPPGVISVSYTHTGLAANSTQKYRVMGRGGTIRARYPSGQASAVGS